MSLWRQLTYGLRCLTRRSQRNQDVADEVAQYFEEAIAVQVARGLSVEEARRAASLEEGNMSVAREQARSYGWENAIEALCGDLRFASRQLRKSPGFTLTAILTLALGIGANTAIFTVVNTVLLKPLSYPDADRIVSLGAIYSPGGRPSGGSIPHLHNWQQQTSIFKEVAAYDFAGPGFNLTGDHLEQVHGIHVTEGYFRLFGAPVMLGRTFTPQEDTPNGGKVAVLSYGLWQRNFGGNPKIVGSSLSLGNQPYTIVGVLAKSFQSDPEAEIWLPFQFDPNSADQGDYQSLHKFLLHNK
jgi:hypothetical protein